MGLPNEDTSENDQESNNIETNEMKQDEICVYNEKFYGTRVEDIENIQDLLVKSEDYKINLETRKIDFMTMEYILNQCRDSARRLTSVINWMKRNQEIERFLKIFAHSASCKIRKCTSFCQMFKRTRKHVVEARHRCVSMRVYQIMLQLHVKYCTSDECGLPVCPILRRA